EWEAVWQEILREGRTLIGCIADLADEEFTQEELDLLRNWSKRAEAHAGPQPIPEVTRCPECGSADKRTPLEVKHIRPNHSRYFAMCENSWHEAAQPIPEV